MAFVPSERDMRWLEKTAALVRHGGYLAYPTSGLVYRVEKQSDGRCTLVLVNPDVLEHPHANEEHERTKAVAEKLNYLVLVL